MAICSKSRKARDVGQKNVIILFSILLTLQFLQAAAGDEKFASVDELFSEWAGIDSPGCALAVIRDGRIIYERGYGLANLDYGISIKPQTVFMIGSTSKQFTAASILILQHRGLISLDDDIRKYIPEMPKYGWPIKIRHLIHHTSGIREYELLQTLGGELTDQGRHRNDDLLELISRQKGLDFRPGEKYQYSNSGYVLLAIIVERVAGKSLGKFIKDNIFDPLGMTRTLIYEDNRAVIKDRAIGYLKVDGEFKVDESLNESTGDGGVYTTIEDFFLWDQNFYHNRIGYPDLIDDMHKVGWLNGGNSASFEHGGRTYEYAFGLILSSYRGLRTVSHSGAYVGFRTSCVRFPSQQFSVICLANLANMNTADLCYKIADIFLKDDFAGNEKAMPETKLVGKKAGKPLKLPSRVLDEYNGDYYNDEVPAIYRLRSWEGQLFFIQKNAPSKEPLGAEGRDAFWYWGLRLKFDRGKSGAIIGFRIETEHLIDMSFRKTRGGLTGVWRESGEGDGHAQ